MNIEDRRNGFRVIEGGKGQEPPRFDINEWRKKFRAAFTAYTAFEDKMAALKSNDKELFDIETWSANFRAIENAYRSVEQEVRALIAVGEKQTVPYTKETVREMCEAYETAHKSLMNWLPDDESLKQKREQIEDEYQTLATKAAHILYGLES
ncbi:hypothetical protein A3A38_01505 [Candidatus Kaiserbacteria bacterium RIFCSPLOWO2_01_FULL_53_17]|uniref:Uncharacterized protein n=1 Tax=Candidatus Kaiserbacteria bacterium RIFCSPLOWO2_01_FULL_53_17 TaxID=1798511 RepID=A0A1F6EI92_9BACT|nr:MAG: hypothetical protein A3A38_01505 [Candidatus Kaiserbacteria bacterium RIFCSPLOWO2_01_FULL_53_17]